jgi:hypothetical protein
MSDWLVVHEWRSARSNWSLPSLLGCDNEKNH